MRINETANLLTLHCILNTFGVIFNLLLIFAEMGNIWI